MKAVIQRVSRASVTIEDTTTAAITTGLLVLIGIAPNDTDDEITFIADKLLNLRIFEDKDGKMNKSLMDINGELLLISQFTLYGSCQKGRRPSFGDAASPDIALPLYDKLVTLLKDRHPDKVKSGQFAAKMQIDLANEGPVTLILEK